MLLNLPLEIIEKIAGEDLYIQALFCKLNIYNTNRFLINFKKYSFEFYKDSFIKCKNSYSYKNKNNFDYDIMNMSVCYEYDYESFYWFATDMHGDYEQIMEKYDTYSYLYNKYKYEDYFYYDTFIQTFYILFGIIDKCKLFTLKTLLQFIDILNIYSIIVNRYLIYRNINLNITYESEYEENNDIAINLDISLRINNNNYISFFNNISFYEKKKILLSYSHSDRIYNTLFKNINMLKTYPKLSKFSKYHLEINLDNILCYYVKNDDGNYTWFKDINFLLNEYYFYNYDFSELRYLKEEKLLYLHKNISIFNFPSCIFYKIIKNYINLLNEFVTFPKILYIINNNILNNYTIIKKYKLQNTYSKHIRYPTIIYSNISYDIISHCKFINTYIFNNIVKTILKSYKKVLKDNIHLCILKQKCKKANMLTEYNEYLHKLIDDQLDDNIFVFK